MDYHFLCPHKVSEEITNNRNVAQINYKNDRLFLTLLAPGYNQKTPIENAIFGITEKQFDLKIIKYENDFKLKLKPKLISYPINIAIYPLNNFNFKAKYTKSFLLLQTDKIKLSSNNQLLFDSRIKEGEIYSYVHMQTRCINCSFSVAVKRRSFRSNLIKSYFVIGNHIFNVGFSFLPKKIMNKTAYTFAANFSRPPFELSTKLKHNNFKTFLKFQKSPYSLDLALESKQEKYGYVQLSYANFSKSVKLIVDSNKKTKFQTSLPIDLKTSVDFCASIPSFKEIPILSLSLNFNE